MIRSEIDARDYFSCGLMAVLLMSIFLLPSLYVWFERDGDRLPDADRVPSA
jgi:hypothetical protein